MMRRMYIRIAQVSFDPSGLDRALAVIREHGVPSMRAAPGFGNLYLGVDREQARVSIVSSWDTLEHASFANPPDFVARFEGLGMQGGPGSMPAGQPPIYEVTDQV